MSNDIKIKLGEFDEGPIEATRCTCEKKEACRLFSEFLRSIQSKNSENRFENENKIREILKKDDISLATRFCCSKRESILKTLLEEVPEGCDIVRGQLDELFSVNFERGEPSTIDVHIGKLYEQDRRGEQSKILQELLSIRNRCINSGGRSYEALNGLIQHPVMAIFILEKWSRVNISFFIHLRCSGLRIAQ